MAIDLHLGAILGAHLYKHLWQFRVVLFAHAVTTLYEQNIEVRHQVG